MRRTAVGTAAAALLLFLLYCGAGITDRSDSRFAVPTAHSLLYDGDLDLSELPERYHGHFALTTVDGRMVNYFPWLTSAAAVPVLAVHDAVAAVGIWESSGQLIDADRLHRLQLLTGATFATLAALALGLVAREVLRLAGPAQGWLPAEHPRTLPVMVLIMGLGTTLLSTASRGLWQHGPSVCLGATAMWCVLRLLRGTESRWPGWLAAAAGLAAALAYWVRPTNLVLGAALAALLLWRRPRSVLPYLAGGAAGHCLVVAANLVLLGRILPPYFAASRVGWHEDLAEAVAANVVSPARGLFVFSPFLLAAGATLARRRRTHMTADLRAVVTVSWLAAGAYLVVVSGYGEKWWAGESFGPRFTTEVLVVLAPLAMLGMFGPLHARTTAATRRWRAGAVVAVAVSIGVHLGAAHSVQVRCWNKLPVNVDDDPGRVWDVTRPQMLEPLRVALGRGHDEDCRV